MLRAVALCRYEDRVGFEIVKCYICDENDPLDESTLSFISRKSLSATLSDMMANEEKESANGASGLLNGDTGGSPVVGGTSPPPLSLSGATDEAASGMSGSDGVVEELFMAGDMGIAVCSSSFTAPSLPSIYGQPPSSAMKSVTLSDSASSTDQASDSQRRFSLSGLSPFSAFGSKSKARDGGGSGAVQTCAYSLSLIFPMEKVNLFNAHVQVVQDRCHNAAISVMAHLSTNPLTAVANFAPYVNSLYRSFELLVCNEDYFPKSIDVANTLFSSTRLDGNPSIDELLSRAITSHLQTHGHSVVFGKSLEQVNEMVSSLALLLLPEERCGSRLCQGPDTKFVPDLYVQGVLAGNAPCDEDCILAMKPVTLIDLDNRSVKQGRQHNAYSILRKAFIQSEAAKTASSFKPDPAVDTETVEAQAWKPAEGLFQLVKIGAPFIHIMLDKCTELTQDMRIPYVLQTLRTLAHWSVALIHYVQAEGGDVPDSTVKRMREDLDISSDEDFLLVLAMADKLKPGSFTTVAGNPAEVGAKVMQLFESF